MEEEKRSLLADTRLIEKEVIQSVPQSMQIKARLLLNRLKASNVSWSSAGEIVINDMRYPGTNIIDLMNDVMRNRKYSAPFGCEKFAQHLASIKVPQEMILNDARWNYITKQKQNQNIVELDITDSDHVASPIAWTNY